MTAALAEPVVGAGLPLPIVAPVMLAADAFEASIALIGNTAIWGFFVAVAMSDWFLDVLLTFTLGFVCKPCAGVIIWTVNIAMLPIYFAAWFNRFLMETIGLLIDGWLLAFKFYSAFCSATVRARPLLSSLGRSRPDLKTAP